MHNFAAICTSWLTKKGVSVSRYERFTVVFRLKRLYLDISKRY